MTAIEKPDEKTFQLPKKSDFDAAKARYKATTKKNEDESKVLNDYLAESSEERKLHVPAFKKAMAIMKMKEPGRGEYLYHLGAYLKWLGALDQPDLMASDRDDETKDLRPRHLREADAEKEISEAADKTKLGDDGKPLQ